MSQSFILPNVKKSYKLHFLVGKLKCEKSRLDAKYVNILFFPSLRRLFLRLMDDAECTV